MISIFEFLLWRYKYKIYNLANELWTSVDMYNIHKKELIIDNISQRSKDINMKAMEIAREKFYEAIKTSKIFIPNLNGLDPSMLFQNAVLDSSKDGNEYCISQIKYRIKNHLLKNNKIYKIFTFFL